jgi:hypothetical protein
MLSVFLSIAAGVLLLSESGRCQLSPNTPVYVKVGEYGGVGKREYVEIKDSWMSPSVLVLPRTSAAASVMGEQLEKLQHRLWSVLFYGDKEPNVKTLFSLLSIVNSLKINDYSKESVARYMLPPVSIYLETDHKKNKGSVMRQSVSDLSSTEQVLEYIEVLKKHRQRLAEIVAAEVRVKSPYGLGDHIILSISTTNNTASAGVLIRFASYLTLRSRYDLMRAEVELSRLLRRLDSPARYDHIHAKLLVRGHGNSTAGYWVRDRFAVPWEYGGGSVYPSVSQLRAELVDRLGNPSYRYAPMSDRVFTPKSVEQDESGLKCRRTCVDHLDSGMGFEVAVACQQQSGCVPLAMTLLDSNHSKHMDVPLRRLPAFLFAAAITAQQKGIAGVAKMLAEVVVFSHTSSVRYVERVLRLAWTRQYYPQHLLKYREELRVEVFGEVLMLVRVLFDEEEMGRVEQIPPNWDADLMRLIDGDI